MTVVQDIQSVLTEMKAINPIAIDLSRYKTYCDTMLVATGTSDRHVLSIGERIQGLLKHHYQLSPLGVEGGRSAEWLLIDYGDVVVHLFQEGTRRFYDLEGMWGYTTGHL